MPFCQRFPSIYVSGVLCLLAACPLAAHATEPPVLDLAFTGDGKTIVAVSQAGVQIYNWPELSLQRTLKSSNTNLHCVEFSPDGTHLAIGGGAPADRGSVEVFAWPGGALVQEFGGHADSVRSTSWRNDQELFSGSLDRSVRLWSMEHENSTVLKGHSRGVDAVCAIPESPFLLSAGADQSLRVWNVENNQLLRSLSQHTGRIRCLALQPSGSKLPLVASAANDRTLRFWQPTIGRMLRYVRLESQPLALAWVPDGSRILASCADGKVYIADPINVQVVAKLEALPEWAYALAVHPNGQTLAVGGIDGTVVRIELDSKVAADAQP